MDKVFLHHFPWLTMLFILAACTAPIPAGSSFHLAPGPAALPPTALPLENPASRAYHGMAYDSESRRVIMFGGITGTACDLDDLNYETWSFDLASQRWTKMSPRISPDGYFAELIYDSRADRVILVTPADASTPTSFDFKRLHTWAYDFNTDSWVRRADGPSGRTGHRLAYDSRAGKVLLFGGVSQVGQKYLNDTWAYDYQTDRWVELKPPLSPEPRSYHGMAYSTAADKTMVWGGDVNGDSSMNLPHSVWFYNYTANTWEIVPYKNAPAGFTAWGLVYDEKADLFVAFGGVPPNLGFTLSYDLKTNTWQRVKTAQNPGPLTYHSMVYVTNQGGSILFGGQQGRIKGNFIANTWFFDLKEKSWKMSHPVGPGRCCQPGSIFW